MSVLLPLANFIPDQPSYSNAGSNLVINAVPKSLSSYGPVSSLVPMKVTGIPTSDVVIGMYHFIDNESGIHLYAATEKHLYHLSLQTNHEWVDATDLTTVSYHASIDDPWQFCAYGNTVIAVNGGDAPQAQTIGNETFSALTQAPFAKCCATVRDFLFLGNVVELGDSIRYPQRLHWSSIGDAAGFPDLGTNAAVQTLSDAQDLRSDLGEIRVIVSNLQTADLAVFMDNGVYAGNFVGGSAIWSFSLAQGAVGCRSPSSAVVQEGYVYYLSNNGFYKFDGTSPNPVGSQKVDDFFFHDKFHSVDIGFIDRVQASADPATKNILWLYHGPNSGGTANRVLIYNYVLDRWGLAVINAQHIAKGISLGYSLDELDPFTTPPQGIESLPYNLDSPNWKGGFPGLYAFDSLTQLCQFGGPNLAARLETTELQLTPNKRSRVTNTRPMVEGFFPSFNPTKPSVALGYRDRLEDQVIYNNAVPLNVYGEAPHRADSRFFRGVVTIPEGADWEHCLGVELSFGPSTPR